MSLTYGVISITALVLLGACMIVDRKKENWLRLLFVSVFVANLGYFLLSVSKTLDFALLSNRIAYAGNVFLPFFMLMIILNLCRVHYPKWLPAVLTVIGFAVLVLAASPGYLTVYYKTVSFEIVNGTAMLIREYGPLHILYYIYLFLYFAAMLAAIVFSMKRKRVSTPIQGILLLSAVFIDIIVWLVEQFRPRGFEFLSIAYILSEALVLILYSVYQRYNIKRRVICVWTLAFTGVGIALACKFVLPGEPEYYLFSLLRSFIYMGMYYAWGRIVCHGIIQKVTRRCFGWVSILLVFWIAVSSVKHLVFLAIRECVTNCVRHAGGNRVFVKVEYDGKQTVCAITNNGRTPQQAVIEGSGLSGLRRRIEREGGAMELTDSPRFVLTVILPVRKSM